MSFALPRNENDIVIIMDTVKRVPYFVFNCDNSRTLNNLTYCSIITKILQLTNDIQPYVTNIRSSKTYGNRTEKGRHR